MMFLKSHLLPGRKLCGQWRQVAWGSGRLGYLTKLCLGRGYGNLGMRSHVYGAGYSFQIWGGQWGMVY